MSETLSYLINIYISVSGALDNHDVPALGGRDQRGATEPIGDARVGTGRDQKP